MTARNLRKVMEAMYAVDATLRADIGVEVDRIIENSVWTAPEQQWQHFESVQRLLISHRPWPEHPMSEALRLVWNDPFADRR